MRLCQYLLTSLSIALGSLSLGAFALPISSLPLSTSRTDSSSLDDFGPPTSREVAFYGLQVGRYASRGESQGESWATVTGEQTGLGFDGQTHEPWRNPRVGGGSMLDLVNNGLREPINVIISSSSDPYILTDSGLRDYVRSIGFSFECLDLHIGDLQRADLGDGRGWIEEMYEFRSTSGFGAPGRWVGACWESWGGGNHFRAWKQNGSEANTGAWFLAVSTEKNLRHHHTIAENGYDDGRDSLVRAAIDGGRFGSRLWRADVQWIQGLLPRGSDGINHAIPIDGLVAVLTVQRYWTVPPTRPGRESTIHPSISGAVASSPSLQHPALVPSVRSVGSPSDALARSLARLRTSIAFRMGW